MIKFLSKSYQVIVFLVSAAGLYFAISGGSLESIQNQIDAWSANAEANKVEAETRRTEAEIRKLNAKEKLIAASAEAEAVRLAAVTRAEEKRTEENLKRLRAEAESRKAILEAEMLTENQKVKAQASESNRRMFEAVLGGAIEHLDDFK